MDLGFDELPLGQDLRCSVCVNRLLIMRYDWLLRLFFMRLCDVNHVIAVMW